MGICHSTDAGNRSQLLPGKPEPNVEEPDAEPSSASTTVTRRKSSTAKKGRKHKNHALVFIKPHAVNVQVEELVAKQLKSNNVEITSRGTFTSDQLKSIIDTHYSTLALHALKTDPAALCESLPQSSIDGFLAKYGVSTTTALEEGRFLNLSMLQKRLPHLSAMDIDNSWSASSSERYKLSPGTYVSLLSFEGEDEKLWVVNGFYAAMREKYVADGASVVYFTVAFTEEDLSWKDFRSKVVGATEPSKADPSSIRAQLHASYEQLGLEYEPNIGDNGIHASAGPVEGLKERMTWLGNELHSDPFGKRLLESGVPVQLATSCCNNDYIDFGTEAGNAFDLLEDVDSSEVIAQLVNIGGSDSD